MKVIGAINRAFLAIARVLFVLLLLLAVLSAGAEVKYMLEGMFEYLSPRQPPRELHEVLYEPELPPEVLQELKKRSTHSIVGRVGSMSSWFGEDKWGGDGIYTQATVYVEEILKGELKAREIKVRYLGGTIGLISLSVSSSSVYPDPGYSTPELHEGERVKLYLEESGGVFSIVGGDTGTILLQKTSLASVIVSFLTTFLLAPVIPQKVIELSNWTLPESLVVFRFP